MVCYTYHMVTEHRLLHISHQPVLPESQQHGDHIKDVELQYASMQSRNLS